MNARRGAVAALLVVVFALAIGTQATARPTGGQTFGGVIVSTGRSGERAVVNSVVVARGVFDGVGQVAEVPNLPGDPDNVSRDDLVFADGTIHILETLVDFQPIQNGKSCHFNADIGQTVEIVGGTGIFADASGSLTSSLSGPALLATNPDGSCAFGSPSLQETDKFRMSGTMSL